MWNKFTDLIYMLTQLDVHLIERWFRLKWLGYVDKRALILKIVEFKRKCM